MIGRRRAAIMVARWPDTFIGFLHEKHEKTRTGPKRAAALPARSAFDVCSIPRAHIEGPAGKTDSAHSVFRAYSCLFVLFVLKTALSFQGFASLLMPTAAVFTVAETTLQAFH